MSEVAEPMHVVGFAGSLRKTSFNRGLIRAAQELAPEGMEIQHLLLDDIPFFNLDVEKKGDPAPVQNFKTAIREADGVLIATPEYGYGITGVLKNALDWASRPPGDAPLNKKPVAMFGASPGMIGTARSHLQLRQSLLYNECHMVKRPEVLVARAREKFDDEGNLTDEDTKPYIRKLLAKLADTIEDVRRIST